MRVHSQDRRAISSTLIHHKCIPLLGFLMVRSFLLNNWILQQCMSFDPCPTERYKVLWVVWHRCSLRVMTRYFFNTKNVTFTFESTRSFPSLFIGYYVSDTIRHPKAIGTDLMPLTPSHCLINHISVTVKATVAQATNIFQALISKLHISWSLLSNIPNVGINTRKGLWNVLLLNRQKDSVIILDLNTASIYATYLSIPTYLWLSLIDMGEIDKLLMLMFST